MVPRGAPSPSAPLALCAEGQPQSKKSGCPVAWVTTIFSRASTKESQDQGSEGIGWGNGSWVETRTSRCNCPHHGSHTAQGMLSRVQLFAATWTVAAGLLCLWNFPGKNTRMGCHVLLQGIFPTQGSNPSLLHCEWILYH